MIKETINIKSKFQNFYDKKYYRERKRSWEASWQKYDRETT